MLENVIWGIALSWDGGTEIVL